MTQRQVTGAREFTCSWSSMEGRSRRQTKVLLANDYSELVESDAGSPDEDISEADTSSKTKGLALSENTQPMTQMRPVEKLVGRIVRRNPNATSREHKSQRRTHHQEAIFRREPVCCIADPNKLKNEKLELKRELFNVKLALAAEKEGKAAKTAQLTAESDEGPGQRTVTDCLTQLGDAAAKISAMKKHF